MTSERRVLSAGRLPIYEVVCPYPPCGAHPGESCWDEPTRSFLTASESHDERKARRRGLLPMTSEAGRGQAECAETVYLNGLPHPCWVLVDAGHACPHEQPRDTPSASEIAALRAHLRCDAPSATCSACGRKTWDPTGFGYPCRMPQSSGALCAGTFSDPTAPASTPSSDTPT